MTPISIAAPSVIVLALASCASQKNAYDTSDPYGAPDAGYAASPAGPATEPANPVYDTPAAYEEGGATAAPAPAHAETAAAPAPSGNGAAIIHTVVKGDTLSGISKKYKVPIASIKQANRMTNDTVVLGRKMVIPNE